MPYKDPEKQKQYAREYHYRYYSANKEARLAYRKTHRKEDRITWRKYYQKRKKLQQESERKKAIHTGMVYKTKRMFS